MKIWESIKAWCKDEDWWYLAVLGVSLEVLLGIFGQWGLFILGFVIAGATLGLEWWNCKKTGLSMSDQLREWKKSHRIAIILVLWNILILVLALIYHFMGER